MTKEPKPNLTKWWKGGINLPLGVAGKWRALTAGNYGELKILGTAAASLVCAMPKPVRDDLTDAIALMARRNTDDITPEAIWRVARRN